MSLDTVQLVFAQVWEMYSHQLPWVLGFATLFTLVSVLGLGVSSPGRTWWKNPGLATDVSYLVIHTAVGTYLRLPALIIVSIVLSGSMTQTEIKDLFATGSGPLSALPFWVQVPVFMLLSDFLLYWIHRSFHRSALWSYHAIHHSATQVDWTTSYRSHPINVMLQQSMVLVLMISLGIRPEVIALVAPFDAFLAVWQHSNSRVDLGPLKYVLATPVFHRWHHTLPDEGGESNFAPTFAFWDYVFGTFYMPQGRLPEKFGTDDPELAEGYLPQLVYPFRRFLPSGRQRSAGQ
jgi:sterol desaturase/sphingolipid hydroxylase (fatty acid hydroxylase superfamily)